MPLEGITAVRVHTGDDDVRVLVGLPVYADIGRGDDRFTSRGTVVAVSAGAGRDKIQMTAAGGTIDAGPGDDEVLVTLADAFIGPLSVLGGAGDDTMTISGHAEPGMSLDAGAGDDRITVRGFGSAPGFDLGLRPGRRPSGPAAERSPGSGLRTARHGRHAGRRRAAAQRGRRDRPAAVAVTYRRRPGGGRRPAEVIARGTKVARAAGPLRVPMRTTRAGRSWTRRDGKLKLYVSLITRRGGDRNAYAWDARLAP